MTVWHHDQHHHGQRAGDPAGPRPHGDPAGPRPHGDPAGPRPHGDPAHTSELVSVGIDIGSATTHLAMSELRVGRRDPRLAGKPEVLERRLLGESRIALTPYLVDGRIDAGALERFIRHEAAAIGVPLEDVDTGAVICTGEAARRANAAAITSRVSAVGGAFVCAVAGHHAEAVLGAHGSGAVDLSRRTLDPIVLLDVGGGTAKRSVLSRGHILDTAAINVGTRLIAIDRDARVVRCETAGLEIGGGIGVDVRLGARLSGASMELLAERMAESLIQFLGFAAHDRLTGRLLLTDAPLALPAACRIAVSGGLSEYFFQRTRDDLGDLGLRLASALRRRLDRLLPPDRILRRTGGIRATVLGAGQFSVQLSGETVFLGGGLSPPLRAVPVRRVRLDWDDLSPETVTRALARALGDAGDGGGARALAFDGPRAHGYGAARRMAAALALSLETLRPPGGLVLVFAKDLARTVGQALAAGRARVPFLCIDELDAGDLDFLDIGQPVRAGNFLPVVVKGLVFDHPTRKVDP